MFYVLDLHVNGMAIRCMNEHWDGGGYPEGLRRDRIPLLARIVGLAQVAEIFASEQNPSSAAGVARQRRGSWFDPEIVDAFLRAHHERLDGRGCFRNLPAGQLSPSAKILCAADQLDALSANRPYRGKLPPSR